MISWCIIGTTTHGYFWKWKFAKGDSNCCIFIPYMAMFCLTQSCIWYHLAKNPAHVPSNQAINKEMGKKKHKIMTYYQHWFYEIHEMLHQCYIPYTVPITGSIILKPEGVFDCKMFLFFVFFVTKRCQRCVFFFFYPKLTYTGVPLHICTDVKRKWGKMTRGG